jgi:hypothetical protein
MRHIPPPSEHKPCLSGVMRSSPGQEWGDPVVVFGPGLGTEGQDLPSKRRNRRACVAPRCGFSGNSLAAGDVLARARPLSGAWISLSGADTLNLAVSRRLGRSSRRRPEIACSIAMEYRSRCSPAAASIFSKRWTPAPNGRCAMPCCAAHRSFLTLISAAAVTLRWMPPDKRLARG